MWPFSDHQGVRDWHAPCYHHIRRRFNSHKSVVTSPAYLLLRLLSPLDSLVCRYCWWLNFNRCHSRYKEHEGSLHWDNWSLNNPSRSILSDIVSRLWMSEWTMEWGKKGTTLPASPLSVFAQMSQLPLISQICVPLSPLSRLLCTQSGDRADLAVISRISRSYCFHFQRCLIIDRRKYFNTFRRRKTI